MNTDFSGWIYLVSATAVLCAAVKNLSPSKEYTRYVGFACALAFLLTVAAPAAAAIKKLPDAIKLRSDVIKADGAEYALSGERLADALTEENLSRTLDSLIAEKTGTDAFSSSYDYRFTKGGVLDGVTATLSAKSPAAYAVLGIKKESLEKYLSNLTVCEVEIVLE